jgi:hypothetical protein
MTAATPRAPHSLPSRLHNASRCVSQLSRNALVPCAGDARSHARPEFSSREAGRSAPSTCPLPWHPNRAPATNQRPRVTTLAAAGTPATSRLRRPGSCFGGPTRGRRSAVHASPVHHPLPPDRLRNDRDCSHGLFPRRRPQHLSLGRSAGLASACLLL